MSGEIIFFFFDNENLSYFHKLFSKSRAWNQFYVTHLIIRYDMIHVNHIQLSLVSTGIFWYTLFQ